MRVTPHNVVCLCTSSLEEVALSSPLFREALSQREAAMTTDFGNNIDTRQDTYRQDSAARLFLSDYALITLPEMRAPSEFAAELQRWVSRTIFYTSSLTIHCRWTPLP